MKEDPKCPGKHLDPETGIWPMSEWGNSCYMGFVSESRFGTGTVIPRTDRGTSRRWRTLEAAKIVAGSAALWVLAMLLFSIPD